MNRLIRPGAATGVAALLLLSACGSDGPEAAPSRTKSTSAPQPASETRLHQIRPALNDPGLLIVTCTSDASELALLDPATGQLLHSLTLPTSITDAELGRLSVLFSCSDPYLAYLTEDFRYVLAQMPPSLNSNDRHIGLLDTVSHDFIDVTAATTSTGFSSTSSYDDRARIEGGKVVWERGLEEVWEYDIKAAEGRRTSREVGPALLTTDEVVITTRDGSTAASPSCPFEDGCNIDGSFGADGDLFVFPSSAAADDAVQGLEVETDGTELNYLQVESWVDDTRLVVTERDTHYIVDVGQYVNGRVATTPPTVRATPVLPPNNRANRDMTPSPDGRQLAFISTDDKGVTQAYTISTAGGAEPTLLDLSAAAMPGNTAARLLRWQ